jgi:acid phosphatase
MAMPPYLASPLSLGNLQGTDYLNAIPGLDLPDHRSNFDSETFVRYDRSSSPPSGTISSPSWSETNLRRVVPPCF